MQNKEKISYLYFLLANFIAYHNLFEQLCQLSFNNVASKLKICS